MTTGIYLGGYPSDRFSFTRSYAAQLSIIGDTGDIDQFGDTLIMWIDRSIGYGITYVLKPWIIPWSSNGYTLDFVVHDCWWHAFFDGIHHAQVFTVNYWWRGDPQRPVISIIQPGGGVVETFIHIDGPPPNYWLPPNPTA